ncbi:hypothetical protein HELRODRAFT_191239 [Helobdella robusta]|uniref:A-kinase anchor protein 2 C-terminal domain-containing protein n=1 Tax=Helobdella robusta TaxID=6412 RepID=T1FSS1_HELRO|nr:hypothetical protein HELRODRAFT_191239 [Helobdella robusta]ESO06905.1 hypothetical protein HELRODRAFT_191239 [Helobdella robusta]
MPIYKITNFSSTQDLTKKQPQREQHQQQQQQQQQQHQPQTQNQLQQFNHLDNSQRKPTSNEISTNQNTNNINLSNKSSTTNNNNNNSNYNTKNTNTNKSNSNIRISNSSSKTSFDQHQPIINKNGDVTFYFEKVVDTTPRSSFSSPSLSSSNSYSNFIKANLHPQQQKHSMEESIIEKEIRLQMERELEIRSLKNNSLNRASNNPTPINNISSSSNSIFSHNNNNGGLYQHKRSDSMSLAGSDISNNTATTNTASSGSYYTPEEDVNGNSTISRYVREQNGNLHYKNDNINNINDKNINGSHKNTVDHDFTDNVDNYSSPKSDENGTNKMNYQKRSLVQPFADEDDDPRFKFIQPQQESVIEKEVRLTRQREGSLRRARGYPLVTHTNELESVVEIPLFDPSTNNDDNDTFSNKICNNNCTKSLSNQKLDECDKYIQESGARRFATNRLKQEILKERQREIDLRRLGKINTLSSERVALDAKTLEELASKRSTSELNIREVSNSHLNQKELTSVRDVARPMKKTLTIVNNNDSSCSNVNNETTGGHNDEDAVDNDNIAEWRIEEEILESKRREEELREQRKNLGLQVNTLKPRTNPTFVSSYRRI